MIRHERSVSTGSQPSAHRYSAAHANSSAFSASANPNEDWTKISDLAERRRIQNRIAQRNYRECHPYLEPEQALTMKQARSSRGVSKTSNVALRPRPRLQSRSLGMDRMAASVGLPCTASRLRRPHLPGMSTRQSHRINLTRRNAIHSCRSRTTAT